MINDLIRADEIQRVAISIGPRAFTIDRQAVALCARLGCIVLREFDQSTDIELITVEDFLK